MEEYNNNQKDIKQNSEWYSDDFEQAVKNSVPKHKALSLYKPRIKRSRLFFKHPVTAAVLSSLITCAICLSIFAFALMSNRSTLPSASPLTQTNQTDQGGTIQNVGNSSLEHMRAIPEVYDKVSPAVVSILTTLQSGGYLQTLESMNSGSGVIIREDGYVVTNNHVIEGAASIKVQTIAGQRGRYC